jgi:hypothetical protein
VANSGRVLIDPIEVRPVPVVWDTRRASEAIHHPGPWEMSLMFPPVGIPIAGQGRYAMVHTTGRQRRRGGYHLNAPATS